MCSMSYVMGRLRNSWYILLLSVAFHLHPTSSTHISICVEDASYEYPLDSCPGGIQIRNIDNWFKKTRNGACICGEGAALQFDGPGKPWHKDIYPPGHSSEELIPHLGNWVDYDLKNECEMLQGNRPSALFIDARKYKDPQELPTRATEIIVTPLEVDRLCGSYSIGIQRGSDVRSTSLIDVLKTIMLNTHQPITYLPNPENDTVRVCAYHPDDPQVILAKYSTADWDIPGLAELCEKNLIPPYERPTFPCPSASSCKNGKGTHEAEDINGDLESYKQILHLMAEISLRMKFAQQHLDFTIGNKPSKKFKPYLAILQRSARVFFRGFPDVVKWETLMSALTIFGVTFEGLLPHQMENKIYDHIRMALGRCGVIQDQKRAGNTFIYTQSCTKKDKAQTTIVNDTAGLGQTVSRDDINEVTTGPKYPEGPAYNMLIDLLWKMVQFTQAACLPSADHHPNVHHIYSSAMIELFSAPAVQLMWYHKPEHANKLNRAMEHIFPELPDNVLPTIDSILRSADYSTHFTLLERPKILHMDKRDLRCAGHGKLIWGGKACCYLEEENKKFYFYNRVTFAKI